MMELQQCKIEKDCNQEELDDLFEYQDSKIEHKDPQNHYSNYFNEAIGDIFRELTGCPFSTDYIQEKIRKLKSFGEMRGRDEKNRCESYYNNKKRLKEETPNWIKELNKFKERVRNANIKDCRKQFLLKIPDIQKDITKWGSYNPRVGTYKLKNQLNKFIKILEESIK